MNLFGNTPQEKAMQSLIHDTNAAMDTLNQHLNALDKWLKENSQNLTSTPFIHTEYIRERSRKIESAIDSYYTKFKDNFQPKPTTHNQ